MSRPVIVIGAGGHAKVVVDALLRAGTDVLGLLDADLAKAGTDVLGVPVLGDDSALDDHDAASVRLVNGVGGGTATARRSQVFRRFADLGYGFATVIHPGAVVAPDVALADGAQIMAGAVVQPGTTIGRDAIVNTGARVDHDCRIGDHAHIAPGAVLSGGVVVEAGAYVGAAACVVERRRIGEDAVVGAGAVVVEDVPAGVTVFGIPAKQADP